MLILLFLTLQLSAFDCFPTSIWITLRQMGARVSYAEVLASAPAAEIGYYADPTFTQEYGFTSWAGYGTLETVADELAQGDPVVWCQNRPSIGHCVVVYGLDDTNLYVWDTQTGDEVIPLEEMPQYSYPSGYWMVTLEGGAAAEKPEDGRSVEQKVVER